MGIIAWIVLGLGAGLVANMLIPGKRSAGPHRHLRDRHRRGTARWLGRHQDFPPDHRPARILQPSTWITAIAGAAVLLLVYHLVTSRSGGTAAVLAHR